MPDVFLYTAAHTRVTDFGEVIVKDGCEKAYEEFFGTYGNEIAPSHHTEQQSGALRQDRRKRRGG